MKIDDMHLDIFKPSNEIITDKGLGHNIMRSYKGVKMFTVIEVIIPH